MFTVVESFNTLPDSANDGAVFFCSRENTIFVNKNNEWVSYEDFVGGFEEIASVTIDEAVTLEDAVLFSEAPFFDGYKGSCFYPISFSAGAISALDGGVFDLSVISSEGLELMNVSASKIIYPNFICYYSLDERASEDETTDDQRKALNLPIRTYNDAFNVKGSNVYIEGPVTLKLFKPIGV